MPFVLLWPSRDLAAGFFLGSGPSDAAVIRFGEFNSIIGASVFTFGVRLRVLEPKFRLISYDYFKTQDLRDFLANASPGSIAR